MGGSFLNAIHSLEPIEVNLEEQIPDISREEIRSAISKMKNRKAPGVDEISIEVIKAGGEKMIDTLEKIFNLISSLKKIPFIDLIDLNK